MAHIFQPHMKVMNSVHRQPAPRRVPAIFLPRRPLHRISRSAPDPFRKFMSDEELLMYLTPKALQVVHACKKVLFWYHPIMITVFDDFKGIVQICSWSYQDISRLYCRCELMQIVLDWTFLLFFFRFFLEVKANLQLMRNQPRHWIDMRNQLDSGFTSSWWKHQVGVLQELSKKEKKKLKKDTLSWIDSTFGTIRDLLDNWHRLVCISRLYLDSFSPGFQCDDF